MFGDQAVEEDHRLAEMERDQERAAGLRPPRRRTYADERAMMREQEARDEEFARRLMADMNMDDDNNDDDDLNAQFPFHRNFIHQQHHHRPMPGDFIFAAAAARNNHPFAPIDRGPRVHNDHDHEHDDPAAGGGRPPFPPPPWAPAAPVRRDRVGGEIIDRNRDFNRDMRGGERRPARAGGANARMHW